ncbi:hypothetical protein K439DRAFT_492487 [Ramaria rubella]|nr:hypothetical protein K439DRAFT_492487 [Ramaria rubella]
MVLNSGIYPSQRSAGSGFLGFGLGIGGGAALACVRICECVYMRVCVFPPPPPPLPAFLPIPPSILKQAPLYPSH